jgi:hypothetical protein
MGKELSEMTLEELWDLFPVFLVQHDDRWNEYYKDIEAKITDLLAGYPVFNERPKTKQRTRSLYCPE